MKGVTEWFVSNTLISADNVKDGTPHNRKGVPGFNGKEKLVLVSWDHPIPIFKEDEDFESLFPVRPLVRRSPCVVQAANRDTQAPVEGLGLENSVDVIASFRLFLLWRQLDIDKSNEIWVVYAGTPVRFSLRKFHLVTGLACGQYLAVQKKKGTAGKETPFCSTLFVLESNVTVAHVITMLKKKVPDDPSLRIRYAVLALVDDYLLPIPHYPKIVKEHAEMSENLSTFLNFPWGRLIFEMTMKSIKKREVEQLATTFVVVEGLLYALQQVVLQAAPAIQEGPVSKETIGSESHEEAGELIHHQVGPFKLGNAKDLDAKCEVINYSIPVTSFITVKFRECSHFLPHQMYL